MVKIKMIFYLVICALLYGGCSPDEKIPDDSNGDKDPVDPRIELNDPTTFGINFNEQILHIVDEDVERSGTKWVRVFFDVLKYYPNIENFRNSDEYKEYIALKRKGYSTIMSFKWDFRTRDMSLPPVNSQLMKDYNEFARKMLLYTWSVTDIVVVGNEPFIETPVGERDQRLVDFYISLAENIREFRLKQPNNEVPLFMGAFNNFYESQFVTPASTALLNWSVETEWISGIDLHIHHGTQNDLIVSLDHCYDKLRDDQRILITEFSLMRHWRANNGQAVSANFANKYPHVNAGWRNYQYIDYALQNPVPIEEWTDFIEMSPYLYNRRNYLQECFQLFEEDYPKVYIATYAIRQSYPQSQSFNQNTDPWILNGLFLNRTVQLDQQGSHHAHPYFLDVFNSIVTSN